ncbi:MAG: DNA-3-methyladenine glycosylase 2 family protein [Deltaproteobacteria bacterium]|nr:DNA-3-methyladenine glycosylase 2 family protein [Deltaproteobacteria bacterium]
MTLDPDACYRALRSRDGRFDGVFYVGVATTGVYCRPICPARTPARERCTFFGRAAEAERAGFRACFRCRPEIAPGLAIVDSVPRLVRAAVARIDAGALNERSIDALAGSLGVTSRHLRRSLEAELGVSPVELAQTRRLALAKQLLHDTALPLAQVAFAAGFGSVRRFNAAFLARFGRPPSVLRKSRVGEGDGALSIRLGYRAPLDSAALLAFLRARAIPGVEVVDGAGLRRTVSLGRGTGVVSARFDDDRRVLRALVSPSLAPKLMEIAARLRALFDLDLCPDLVAEHLGKDRLLAERVAARPGLRVPGAFDGFETAVRAVLGQQVSVRAATTVCGRLVAAFGQRVETDEPRLTHAFPTAESLAQASSSRIQSLGLPAARARTVAALARAVARGRVDLAPGADPAAAIAALQEVPGIGPWTAHVVAMRALRWPDAFPAADLGVLRALGVRTAAAAERAAAPWSPWRAYAVLHLWTPVVHGDRP